MEVNETITRVQLDMKEDQLAMLGDEGRQAQGPWREVLPKSLGWKRHLFVSITYEKTNNDNMCRGPWSCGLGKFPPWDAPKPANFFSDSD